MPVLTEQEQCAHVKSKGSVWERGCRQRRMVGSPYCYHHSKKEDKMQAAADSQMRAPTTIHRTEVTIKFFLSDKEDSADVVRRLKDVFSWRDQLRVAVEERAV